MTNCLNLKDGGLPPTYMKIYVWAWGEGKGDLAKAKHRSGAPFYKVVVQSKNKKIIDLVEQIELNKIDA